MMLTWTIRRLAYRPARTAMTVAALAAVIAVILILEGFRSGFYAQLRDAVLGRGAPLIAAQAGIGNFIAVRSSIPQGVRAKIEGLAEVQSASPLTGVPVVFERGGRRIPILLIVSDGIGGPSEVWHGKAEIGDGRIVIDQSLADAYALDVGDPIEINGYPFRVSGIASGAAALFTPFAFIDYGDLIDWFWALDVGADITSFPIVSFFLITQKNDREVREVARAIEAAVPEVDVFEAAELARNDVRLGRDLLSPVLGVLLGVAYVTGVVVAGIITFSSVQARMRDYTVLYALGLEQRAAVVGLLAECALLVSLALPPALALAWGGAQVIEALAPLYRVLPLAPDTVTSTLLGAGLVAILGGLAPLRLVTGVDPGAAFRL